MIILSRHRNHAPYFPLVRNNEPQSLDRLGRLDLLPPQRWLPTMMRAKRTTNDDRLAWFHQLGQGWLTQCVPREYNDALRFMLTNATREELDQTMTSQELVAFAGLPDELTVYRGATEYNAFGVTWTINRIIALCHAGSFARPSDPPPQHHMLLTGRVRKEHAFIKLWPPAFIVMEIVAPDVALLSREDLSQEVIDATKKMQIQTPDARV